MPSPAFPGLAPYPGFCGPSYTSASIAFDGERTVNLIPELAKAGTHPISPSWLSGTPGKILFCTLPNGPVRCLFAGDNRLFAVGGGNLYEVIPTSSTQATAQLLGSVGLATTPAQIFSNIQQGGGNNQLFIVSGAQGSLVDATKSPDGTTKPFPVVAAVQGGYLDSYFIAQSPESNEFFISANLDGSIWNPLDFGVKQGSFDRISGIFVDHEELWLFGRKTTEVWYNSGAANFPFQRIIGAFIEQGLVAPFSVAKLDNSIFWLGGDDRGAGIAWRAQGYTPLRVSNHAVESAWQDYVRKYGDAGIDDAVGQSYQENGHSFYRLDFPTADATWVYDVATDMWHEREYRDPNTNLYHADLGRFHAYVFGSHIVGDYRNGNIYMQSLDAFDDAGDPIRRLRSAPHVTEEAQWLFYDEFQLAMQVGGRKGAIEPFRANGGDPMVMLRTSDDGGYTWSNEIDLSCGRLGEYSARVMARKLGRSRNRCFEVSSTDPIQQAWVDAYLRIRPGLPG